MSLDEFLSRTRREGVSIWLKDDRLRYSAPSAALSPAMYTELAKREASIISLIREAKSGTAPGARPQKANGRPPHLRPSVSQEALISLGRLRPDAMASGSFRAIQIEGQLNVGALSRAIDEIVRRHGVLRTTFPTVSGRPTQLTGLESRQLMRVTDLRSLPEERQEAKALWLVTRESQSEFDVESGPLFRPTLVRFGRKRHLLLLALHQLVADASSHRILNRELSSIYTSFNEGKQTGLPNLPIQYADFSLWQRERLSENVLRRLFSYWRHQLLGAPSILELATDRPRGSGESHIGDSIPFVVPPETSAALKWLSRREGVTLFIALAAAFNVLLHRNTGQNDIVLSIPTENRSRPELRDLIGYFGNHLMLRTNLSGDPTFKQVVGRVREGLADALTHQDLPFGMLAEDLWSDSDLMRRPLLQVMFSFQNLQDEPLELGHLALSNFGVGHHTTLSEINLSMRETPNGLTGEIEYDTGLFEATSIRRLEEQFKYLLRYMSKVPDTHISETQIVPKYAVGSSSAANCPRTPTIHGLFEDQVLLSPDRIALVENEIHLTFDELNRRANIVACRLMDLGVGPEVCVGIFMDRSVDMVIGLLGILKAGGAYVPLEPDYPVERLQLIMEETNAPVVLSQGRLAERLPRHQSKVVCLDSPRLAVAHNDGQNPNVDVSPDNMAYVIYTSGSTGRPKGVVGLHRGAVNRFTWMWDTVPFEPEDIFCQTTSLSFVDSVWEIFGPLLKGVSGVVIDNLTTSDPYQLVPTLDRNRVTRIVLVPSLLRAIIDTAQDLRRGLASLKVWIVSGERLPKDLVQAFRASTKDALLLNLYGSSEVSADITWYKTNDWTGTQTTVPVGRPISNTRIYLLDNELSPVPIGVPGLVYVGGIGLARGYIAQPGLTAQVFVPDPFSTTPGLRLYKMGDQARYLPDGNIDLTGRVDDQVKIRGHRIELGEVERVVIQHPTVSETVVVTQEDNTGDLRVIAYVVPVANQVASIDQLVSFLRTKLPKYMIPASFVTLDSLPVTPSGKADRMALPPPDETRPRLEKQFVAPRTPVEEAVADIWADAIGVDKVGVYDDFFDLGGHSLLATRLIGRLLEKYHIKLTLRNLFEAPNVAELTEHIEAMIWADQSQDAASDEVDEDRDVGSV